MEDGAGDGGFLGVLRGRRAAEVPGDVFALSGERKAFRWNAHARHRAGASQQPLQRLLQLGVLVGDQVRGQGRWQTRNYDVVVPVVPENVRLRLLSRRQLADPVAVSPKL